MFEPWQQHFVIIAFKVGSVLSFGGTGFVIYEVLSDRQKRRKTYFRLLLGLCVIEFLESMVLFCGTWCTPADWFWPGSIGNEATCNVQGFLNQVSVGSSMYSAFLSIYYLLTIRYNIVERYIRQYVEPWMHATTLAWSFGTAIATLLLDLIRPLGNVCYIGRTPPKCKQTYQFGFTTCDQGDNAQLYIMLFFYVWFFVSFAITLISMGIVWWAIRSQENRMVRYNHGNNNANRQLSQRFALQGTLYVLVMWICNIWTVINFIRIQIRGSGIPLISMFSSVLKPLEGFLNFMIYIRPRLVKSAQQRRAKQPPQIRTEVSQQLGAENQQPSTTAPAASSTSQSTSGTFSLFGRRLFSIFISFPVSTPHTTVVNENGATCSTGGGGAGGHDNTQSTSGDNNDGSGCCEDSAVQAAPAPLIIRQRVSAEIERELRQDAEEQMAMGAY